MVRGVCTCGMLLFPFLFCYFVVVDFLFLFVFFCFPFVCLVCAWGVRKQLLFNPCTRTWVLCDYRGHLNARLHFFECVVLGVLCVNGCVLFCNLNFHYNLNLRFVVFVVCRPGKLKWCAVCVHVECCCFHFCFVILLLLTFFFFLRSFCFPFVCLVRGLALATLTLHLSCPCPLSPSPPLALTFVLLSPT